MVSSPKANRCPHDNHIMYFNVLTHSFECNWCGFIMVQDSLNDYF